MPDRVALIQLVSEQTMQNVVPVLAFGPRRLIHLSTARTAPRSAGIVEAIRQARQVRDPIPLTVHGLSEMPTIAETAEATRAAIGEAREAGDVPLVNFTGGTKLMSLGAYDAARVEGVASVYVDTDHQRLVDGGTGERLEAIVGADLTFGPIEKLLTVNVIAVANGCERVTGGRGWKPYAAVARHLLEHVAEEKLSWATMRDKPGILGGGPEPKTWERWVELSEKTFPLPPALGELAAAADLVEKSGTGWRLPRPPVAELRKLGARERRVERDQHARPPGSPEWRRLDRELQTIRKEVARHLEPIVLSFNFLSGGWLEPVLAEAATRSKRFHDLRWSARTGGRGWGEEQEQDLLGVQGVQIAFFSCKRGGAGAKLVSELEVVQSRARLVGGSFTRRFLCVARPPTDPTVSHALRSRAAELGIHLITGQMLREDRAFA